MTILALMLIFVHNLSIILIFSFLVLVIFAIFYFIIDYYFDYLDKPDAVPSNKLFFKIVDTLDITLNGPKDKLKLFNKFSIVNIGLSIVFLMLFLWKIHN